MDRRTGSVGMATSIFVVLLAGCASHPEPIVDMRGVDEQQLAADMQECEGYSDQVIIAKGVAKGSAGGAAVGAAAGAIDGNAGEGAGYGAIWGATRSGLYGDREKRRVMRNCLRGRGYRVLN